MRSTAVENSIAIGPNAHAMTAGQVVIKDQYGTILDITDQRLREALDGAFHDVGIVSIQRYAKSQTNPLDILDPDQPIIYTDDDGHDHELTYGEIVAAGNAEAALAVRRAELADEGRADHAEFSEEDES